MGEGRALDARPDAAPVRHDDNDAPGIGKHPPHFAQHGAKGLGVLDCMDQQHAVEGVVGKGQVELVHQHGAIGRTTRPVQDALAHRHGGQHALGLLGEGTEIGACVTKPQHPAAAHIGPHQAQPRPYRAGGNAAQAGRIEIAKIDDIGPHGAEPNTPPRARQHARAVEAAARGGYPRLLKGQDMARLKIHRIPARKDNYLWLAHEPDTDTVAIVDPADAEPVIAKCEELGLSLTHILNTHHHGDHTGGNLALKEYFDCVIIGPAADRDRIPGIDIPVGEDDTVALGTETGRVFDVPGHTRGHIAYWFASSDALFCGDTLFAMGCGRLFEGTPAQMWDSLSKFADLPDETRVYCAHEYTEANARFALTVDPDNAALKKRAAAVSRLRAAGKATVPSTMEDERATNPFLRAEEPGLQEALGLVGADAVAVFAETRLRKDNFKA